VLDAGTGLRIALQPIVDLRVAEIAGYEALTRFDRSSAPPDQWFAVAQASGQGPALEALALQRAFGRRAEIPDGLFISVNVSPHLLESAPVQEALAAAAPLSGVVVELTEHVDPGEREPLLRALAALRARGARIALDDMGTGYSGLRELATLRPDVVKLDRAFTDHCDSDTVKAAVVESLCSIADRLQATLVAEGVERLEELDWLQRSGVPLGQGWLLGRPDDVPQPLAAGTAARLRSRAELATPANRATAGAIMRWAPGVAGEEMSATVTRWSRAPDSADAAQVHVVLDAWHRPQALVLWGAHGPAGDEFPITLRTTLETPLTHLARQISARPPDHRFDPVVCTGTDGTYLGVVDVDQLLRVLADQVDSLGRVHVPTTYVPADLQGRPRSSAT
jgi:EAL domain-containing protein (putative c-di-GMP-specific phosphodiesterase class I)